MNNFDTKKYPIFAKFLNQLAKDLTSFYYSKLNRTFKVSNKFKGKGYDPVTTSDKAYVCNKPDLRNQVVQFLTNPFLENF